MRHDIPFLLFLTIKEQMKARNHRIEDRKGGRIVLKILSKLIDVKSIVTLVLTIVFTILAMTGSVSSEQFQTIFTTVIAFYFGTQYQKNSNEKES